jgi:hypothetical protein
MFWEKQDIYFAFIPYFFYIYNQSLFYYDLNKKNYKTKFFSLLYSKYIYIYIFTSINFCYCKKGLKSLSNKLCNFFFMVKSKGRRKLVRPQVKIIIYTKSLILLIEINIII